MRKVIMTVIQMVIFIAAWYLIANRIEANTYFGSVSYNVDVIAENIRWILLGAAGLSVLNIWFWWPSRKVVNTPAQTSTKEVTKSVEAEEVKTEEKDPVVPKMD